MNNTTTRAKRALEIAKFEDSNLLFDLRQRSDGSVYEVNKKDCAIELFSSFNSLMPIIFRINDKSKKYCIEIYEYSIQICAKKTFDPKFNVYKWSKAELLKLEELFPTYNLKKIDKIDALQEAILFYHRNKGKENETKSL